MTPLIGGYDNLSKKKIVYYTRTQKRMSIIEVIDFLSALHSFIINIITIKK